MRFATLTFATVAAFALLGMTRGEASPANACRYTTFTLQQYATNSTLVVVAHSTGDLTFAVDETVWGDDAPATLTIPDPAPAYCGQSPFAEPGPYLLFVQKQIDGYFYSGPANASLSDPQTESWLDKLREGLTSEMQVSDGLLNAVSTTFAIPEDLKHPTQQETTEGEPKDPPWYIFLAGAFIVPLGVIYVLSFIKPPKGGGH